VDRINVDLIYFHDLLPLKLADFFLVGTSSSYKATCLA